MLTNFIDRSVFDIEVTPSSVYASFGRCEMFAETRPLTSPFVGLSKDTKGIYLSLGWVDFTFDRKPH
ncbi:hypothetical protein [Caballeronia sp. ATUFL_M1_KS5A]|uniref:hypothetical protein n=1 Tax=Caballeronia sp. ATUFL_M1_KS5A TaxID=2921778 RepID=UPI00202934C3|nr:hypothetical protein [Caballeronia sp. ATUFL_M1_KS5A]